MLVALGFLMVAVFMYLIMSKRATPVVGLIAVPVAFGVAAGAGFGIGDMITDAIKALAPTAALLFFAIIFFGIMIDVGLFDPLVKQILRLVRNDPMKLVVGTAVLAMVVSLDGDGSTTFIIVTSAMLPLYLKLKVSPVVLTVVAGLANGAMNIIPWGGPTVRAAAALNVSPSDVFVPMVPSMIVGCVIVLLFAVHLGVMERRRIGKMVLTSEPILAGVGGGRGPVGGGNRSGGAGGGTDAEANDFVGGLDPKRATLRPNLLWFNAALTVTLLTVLVLDVLPIPVLFMIASAIALAVNFPQVKQQQEAITRHASSIVSVVAMVFAAAVLTGVFQGTGMVEAMAQWLVDVIPGVDGAPPGRHHRRPEPAVHVLHEQRRLLLRRDAGSVRDREHLRHRLRRDGPRVDHRADLPHAEPAGPGDPVAGLARRCVAGRPSPQGAVARGGRVAVDAGRRGGAGSDPVLSYRWVRGGRGGAPRPPFGVPGQITLDVMIHPAPTASPEVVVALRDVVEGPARYRGAVLPLPRPRLAAHGAGDLHPRMHRPPAQGQWRPRDRR